MELYYGEANWNRILEQEKTQPSGNPFASLRLLTMSDRDVESQLEDHLHSLQDEDCYQILLSHRPELFDVYAAAGVDLSLTGHTHGGQVSLFKRWTPAHFSKYGNRFLTGLKHNSQGIPIIITNGLGTSRKDIRLFTPSEVVLVVLKKIH